MRENAYRTLQERIRELTGLDYGFQNRLAPQPLQLGHIEQAGFEARYERVRDFHRRALSLFFASLDRDADPDIAEEFFRDLPECFGAAFHRTLPRDRIMTPLFFRTDELRPGVIAEVQCPGSGWGEQSLLHEFYEATSGLNPRIVSTATAFNASLLKHFAAPPKVQHFVENSSSFLSNLLHIAYSRRAAHAPQYWGYDVDVRAIECNFIRTHLYVSLLAENFTNVRLDRFKAGEVVYDSPPVCIFEQKLMLHLPFDPRTADYFSDSIRNLFPFTSVVRPTGIMLENGDTVSIEDFASLPARERNVFLKYAGIDPSRNWGSRAVYHAGELSRTQLRERLGAIVADYHDGRGLWIAQAAHSHRTDASFINTDGSVTAHTGYLKCSGFYGTGGFISANWMVRRQKKVHGQRDTTLSLVTFAVAKEEER